MMINGNRQGIKQSWIFFLPLLFLPNLGFETDTPFGTLTVSDYLIGPYIALVFFGGQNEWIKRFERPQKLFIHFLIPALFIFVWWTFISSLTIDIRYGYGSLNPVYFSLLKLGKLSLYGLAAILTIRALSKIEDKDRGLFFWSILVSSILTGLTLLLSGNSLNNILPSVQFDSRDQVFQENPINVMLAMQIMFLIGLLVEGHGSERWRRFASFGLVIILLGFFLANGRGGWVAAIVGSAYIGLHINIKQTIRILLIGSAIVIFAYNQYPSFRDQVDMTINPDPEFLAEYNAGIFGVDDGARLGILQVELPKVLEDPMLGRGFFHRGGFSGIFSTGSHNFFLQMFLETGIVGGITVIAIVLQMWRHASSDTANEKRLSLPVKASLVAAIVSGLSGEYFYGGMVLFTLLLIYAPIGSLKTASMKETSAVPISSTKVTSN